MTDQPTPRPRLSRFLDALTHSGPGYDPSEPVPAVPVSSPPPDQTALRDRIAEAPTDWTDGHPQLEAIAAAVWEHCEHSGSGLVIDDPRNIAVVALNAVPAVLPPPADRAAVLREAADFAEQLMDERYGPDCSYGIGGLDVARELRRLAAEAEQPDTETQAHPPQHSWRVETRDPLADQWAPGSHFAHRPNAVERLDTANRTAPLWNDGTPVERRIVRETTTFTVEAPPPVHKGGNADDCPACQVAGLDTIGAPYECPGPEHP